MVGVAYGIAGCKPLLVPGFRLLGSPESPASGGSLFPIKISGSSVIWSCSAEQTDLAHRFWVLRLIEVMVELVENRH